MATVNIGIVTSLARHVGVTYAPAVIIVSDGHLNYFTGVITVSKIKQFLKSILPVVTVVRVLAIFITQVHVVMMLQLTDVISFQKFISGAINRNRPRLVLFSHHSTQSLHLLLVAKKHCRFIDFGYVSVSDDNGIILSSLFGIYKQTAILVFKEQSNMPIVSVKVCVSL